MRARRVTPILNVSNIQESFAWFEKLGWKKGWDWGDPPGFGGVFSEKCEIFLCQGGQGGRGKGSSKSTFGPRGDEVGDKGVWMSIWVNDVDSVHRHCVEQGLEVTWPPTDMPWNVREMHVRHPDGHVFRISQGLERLSHLASLAAFARRLVGASAVVIALFSLRCNETSKTPEAPVTPIKASTPEEKCVPRADVLCPVDDGTRDPSFAEYRRRLVSAIEKKSDGELTPLVDVKIRTSFGEGGGLATFQPLWKELSEIMNHGGSFQGDGENRMFWAPYVYSRWPQDVDAFTHVAALRAGVPLRDKPASGTILRSLDWSILELVDTASKDPEWRHVRTSDKTTGWVNASDVRSPIGYRAGFRKVGGEWKMTALVKGD